MSGAEGGWSNTGFTRLKHTVEYIHITDLDGNGVKEYLMSDGMDLYLYQKNDNNFRKIWSTHLGVESLYGPITSGDLNRDGVKEVYVCRYDRHHHPLSADGKRTAFLQ